MKRGIVMSGDLQRATAPAVALTLGLGGALLVAACAEPAPPPEPPLRLVRTRTVETSGKARVRTFSGVARADVESRLSFRVAGTVEEVRVEVGDRVDRGGLLARLDPIDYELQEEQAEAALAQARAAERRAVADYDRVRGLYENKNASKSDLDAARAASDSAAAQREAAEKQLELARQRLVYTRLVSPAAGAIASVDVEINENVQAGQPVVLLSAGGRTEVEVAVPEALISGIEQGDPVTVTFDALPGRNFAATVTEVGVAAVGTATTFPVTVRLDADDTREGGAVRSGMIAEVAFRFAGPAGRLLVPPVAVGEDRQGRFVFVVETSAETGSGGETGRGVVRRRAVEVGELTADGLEITAGLSPGERIATAGVRRLEDGLEVRLQEGPPEPSSALKGDA